MPIPKGLPAAVKIGWKDFNIVPWNRVDASSCSRYGECRHMQGEIRIDETALEGGYGPRKAANTLLHEIMHACFAQSTLEKGDDEERIVTCLSNMLSGAMRDSPDVFEWLMRELR